MYICAISQLSSQYFISTEDRGGRERERDDYLLSASPVQMPFCWCVSDVPIKLFQESLSLCRLYFGTYHLNTGRCVQLFGQLYWNRRNSDKNTVLITECLKYYMLELDILQVSHHPFFSFVFVLHVRPVAHFIGNATDVICFDIK